MKTFKERFTRFIQEYKLFQPEDKVLIGLSGGIDSVTLAHLFLLSGFKFGIAHCNFSLRGTESDADEAFVKAFAEKHQVPFFTNRFNTLDYATENKMSIQMAAREMRFEWFENLRLQEGYKYIALAHHNDDEVETFFINMIRGTGITGLSGIKPKRNSLLHPLLFASRMEIEEFVNENQIQFREDKSNLTKKYLRNKLRLDLLPEFEKLNPSFKQTIKAEIKRLKDVNSIFQEAVNDKRRELFYHSSDYKFCSIYITELKKLKPIELWVFELLSTFNFNIETIREIIDALDGEPGKKFFSDTHRLIKDREMLIISELLNEKPFEGIEITTDTSDIVTPIPISFSSFAISDKFKVPASPYIACLDANKMSGPIRIRRWENGDRFMPLGMTGFKKVSDFLIDLKIPLSEKEKIFVMTSGNEIAWVIGYRIDNRFKLTPETGSIFKASLSPSF
ncbi:MAG: tRNA lysidine(34) synthetase TilS [Bacteroidetes bacterium]|nr:tRNA lysidine(34) synthetase TilS [Bacteroidota bacterium]